MFAGAAIIAVAVFLAYFPSINGGFVLDDELYVTNTKVINASDGLYRIWCTTEPVDYWPMSNSTLWIEWRLWELNSTGYHVTNLILHVAAALFIWIILRKMSIPGAFFAAIVFALHPVNVQSVAWIAQLKNMMAMLFFLLSILWYLKDVRSHGGSWERGKTFSSFILHPSSFNCWYCLSLAAFVLAMLSKTSAAVLPVLLMGIAWWLSPKNSVPIVETSKTGQRAKILRDLAATAPFFAIAIALTLVNMWFQTHGMDVAYRTAGFGERLLGAAGVIWFYLYKALLPLNLVFVYPQWSVETANPLWWLPLAAAAAVTAVLWRYRKDWSRPLMFAWGFFCVALAPVLGLKDVGFMEHSLVADQYQYIAIIGVICLISAGFYAWHGQMRSKSRQASGVAFAAVAILAFLTWRQSGLYRDAITLYQATLEKNPESWMVQNNLGLALEKAGRPQAALGYYREALRIKPNYADAHYNQGFALVKLGRLPEAVEEYKQAVKLKSDYSQAYNDLGIVFYKMGRLQDSIEQFQIALRLKNDLPESHNNLGIALAQSGRHKEAIEQYHEAINLKPDYDKAYFNLGNAYKAIGQRQEAIANYRQALELARSHGQTALAMQIENTLNSYGAGPINPRISPSDSKSTPPPP
jgi:protein O-mannosyl-transferase